MRGSSWFAPSIQSPRARLFCFPPAGAGSVGYRSWRGLLPRDVDLCPAMLPGRETRRGEPPGRDLVALAREAARAMSPLLDAPYALLGYCMGAYMVFEVARELRRLGKRLPDYLLVAGRRAPHLPDIGPPMSRMSDRDFIAALEQRYAGLPPHVRANPDLLAMYLAALRADFVVLDGYECASEPPLPVPIHAFVGTHESAAAVDEMQAWASHTSTEFVSHSVEGKHLVLPESKQAFVDALIPFLQAMGK